MPLKIGLLFALGALPATPAAADILVYLAPATQVVPLAAGQTAVAILADIPADEAIIGWGLDLATDGDSASPLGAPLIGPLWSPLPTADADGLAGGVPFAAPAISGDGVLLATVTFALHEVGRTDLLLGDSRPFDLSEGFALNPPPVGAFADVAYVNGPGNSITVVPEPGVFGTALLTALALRRRPAGR